MYVRSGIVNLARPTAVGSSVSVMPPMSTGLVSGLYSSNQSAPEVGFAIHSLNTTLSGLANATGAAFGLPGVGSLNNCHRPALMPIGWLAT